MPNIRSYITTPDTIQVLGGCADIHSSIHGAGHWARVARYGTLLAHLEGLSPELVQCTEIFGWVHDLARHDDGYDPNHGKRGAEKFEQLSNQLFPFLKDRYIRLISEAVRHHSCGYNAQEAFHDGVLDPLALGFSRKKNLKVIACCWDADRLDLIRLGKRPIPALMSTEHWVYVEPYAMGLNGYAKKVSLHHITKKL